MHDPTTSTSDDRRNRSEPSTDPGGTARGGARSGYRSAPVDDLVGLLDDVTRALVDRDSRGAVERAAAGRLAAVDRFALAWVGRRDRAREAIVAAAWAPGSAGTFSVPTSDEGVVPAAVEAGELRVGAVAEDVRDAAVAAGPVAAPDLATTAAVPLSSGGTSYGVLAVTGPAETAFGSRERSALGAVGRATATAIDARERRRMLASDDVVELAVEVRDPSLFPVSLARAVDREVAFVGATYPDDGPPLWFLTAEGADPGAVEAFVEGRDSPAAVAPLAAGGQGAVFEFTVSDDPLARRLVARGGQLQALTAEPGLAALSIELPRRADARAVVEMLEERYDGVDLRALQSRERPARTRGEFVAALEERLTDRQLTALGKAYAGGFFEWPHDTTGEELAASMDISRSTFHQHLRAAQRKLVAEFHER